MRFGVLYWNRFTEGVSIGVRIRAGAPVILLGGMVNFTLLFTTNEMISISFSETFRS